MSQSVAQENSNTGTGTSISVTLPGAITAGASLVVAVRATGSGAAVSGISGGGATWTLVRADNNISLWYSEIWHGVNSGGGSAAIVVSFVAALASGGSVLVQELTLPATPDGSTGANGGNGTSMNSGSITPTSGGDGYLINCGAFQANTTAVAGPSGWTSGSGGAPTQTQPASYKLVPSFSGSYNATYGIGYNRYAVSIAAFKATGGGGGGPAPATGLWFTR